MVSRAKGRASSPRCPRLCDIDRPRYERADVASANLGHRGLGLSGLPPLRAAAQGRARGGLPRQLLHRVARQHRAPARQPPLRAGAPRRDRAAHAGGRRGLPPRLPGLADPLPAQPGAHDPHRRRGDAQHARPRARGAGRASSSRRRPRSTAIRSSTRSARATGATSTPSARAPATTRASAAPRRWPSRTRASTRSRCASRASSTPTARACTRTTGAWSRTSSCRRCATSRSPSTARGSRRARSATRPISSRASSASWPASTASIRSTSATRARRRCSSWPR